MIFYDSISVSPLKLSSFSKNNEFSYIRIENTNTGFIPIY
ncbi:hypothetical protein MUS_3439 [Bacillus velezensis YAU B9601-Y2]|uniref:Uncharacterized protein n=1 Tax=Bacillus amyloliquefaciens (strain Y2) TaxID=1155777 RepID=I2C9I6_BACAY|nr:hypothetical protein MUS_3439 [Bacillus velezensis YAU B9601-Y2]RUS02034.1 hypothetical protein EFW58_04449 [Bacillus velezensis]